MRFVVALAAVALCSCEQPKEASSASSAASTTATSASSSAIVSSASSLATTASASPASSVAAQKPVWHLDGFQTPESVLYDAENDRYIVSNINGKPYEADNNGYLSLVSPDGKIVAEKWVAGGVNKVKLDAPKGSAILGGAIYVADITSVRKFDLKTGAPLTSIAITGAQFLNDITVSADGKLYVSDTGVKGGEKGLEPAGGDAVYVIEKDKPKLVAKGKELHGPNGLLATKEGVWVVTFGAAELYRLDEKGAKLDVTTLPAGGLDGFVAVGDSVFISSWQGKGVFKGTLRGAFTQVLSGLEGPADIGYDSKRGRLLVPRFMGNAVEVYEAK